MLLDEPLSNLDVVPQAGAAGDLRELLRERRATAIYVTHDPREARALGDRTAVLDTGRIDHLGRLEDLRDRSDLPFARSLMESLGLKRAASAR